MAINNINNYNALNDAMAMPLSMERGNPNPLDSSCLWETLDDAENYAKNDPTAYVGQILSVIGDEEPAAYIIINEDGDLKPLSSDSMQITDFLILNCGGALAANEGFSISVVNTDNTTIQTLALNAGNSYAIQITDSDGNIMDPELFTYTSSNSYVSVGSDGVVSVNYQDGMPMCLDAKITVSL